MTTFDIKDWADFVRGVGDPEAADGMRAHLESDPAARKTVAALRRVVALGRSDQRHAPPESAVRLAKVVGGLPRPRTAAGAPPGRPRFRLLPATVTFDSRLAPAPVGTRSLESDHRRVRFAAGGYHVDVRLEGELRPPSTVVVGQIVTEPGSPEAAHPIARAPVFAFSGDRLVGQALSGPHGEFQLEGLPREPLELCLVAGEDFLQLPLSAADDRGS